MDITLLKYPTDEDWTFAKQCALVTIGKEMKPCETGRRLQSGNNSCD